MPKTRRTPAAPELPPEVTDGPCDCWTLARLSAAHMSRHHPLCPDYDAGLRADGLLVALDAPGVELVSELNRVNNRWQAAKIHAAQARVVGPLLEVALRGPHGRALRGSALALTVSFERYANGLLDEPDNLASSTKGLRDLVARALGRSDGPRAEPRTLWRTTQRLSGRRGLYGCALRVEPWCEEHNGRFP